MIRSALSTAAKFISPTGTRPFTKLDTANLLQSLVHSVSIAAYHQVTPVIEKTKEVFEEESLVEAERNRDYIYAKSWEEAAAGRGKASGMCFITADLVSHQDHIMIRRCADEDPDAFEYLQHVGPISLVQTFVKSLTDDAFEDVGRLSEVILKCQKNFTKEENNVFTTSLKFMASLSFIHGIDLAMKTVLKKNAATAIKLLSHAGVLMNFTSNFPVAKSGKITKAEGTPLHCAIIHNDEPNILALLEAGASPTIAGEKGEDAIRLAIFNHADIFIINKLIETALNDKNFSVAEKFSSYVIAARSLGRVDVLNILLSNSKANHKDDDVKQALIGAVMREDFKAAYELMRDGIVPRTDVENPKALYHSNEAELF